MISNLLRKPESLVTHYFPLKSHISINFPLKLIRWNIFFTFWLLWFQTACCTGRMSWPEQSIPTIHPAARCPGYSVTRDTGSSHWRPISTISILPLKTKSKFKHRTVVADPGFSGVQLLRRRVSPLFGQNFLKTAWKWKWKEENWTERGGWVRPKCVCVDLPLHW